MQQEAHGVLSGEEIQTAEGHSRRSITGAQKEKIVIPKNIAFRLTLSRDKSFIKSMVYADNSNHDPILYVHVKFGLFYIEEGFV